MADPRPDFMSVLVRNGVVTPEQLEEAVAVQHQAGGRLEDALVRLGYATPAQVVEALAEAYDLPFLDLSAVTVPPSVLELVPESVARENIVLPLAYTNSGLWLVVSDPGDFDTIQRLQFILNKDVRPVLGIREQIIEAINRHYGQTETESVDSMLAEFTDTAIDFTETEYELALGDQADDREDVRDIVPTSPAASDVMLSEAVPARTRYERSPFVERQATVRYYHRMNPGRMFPLLVVLSKKAVLEAAKRGVSQATSGRFRAEADSLVEVEPVLPGCHCYPPKEQVVVRQETVTVTFWVVPHVLGRVMHARVLVRQEGRVLAEVPLEVRVVKQTLSVLLGALGVVVPFVFLLLKHFRLDFESQLDQGFGLYAQAAGWALRALSPEWVGALLFAAAVAAYLWLRPRRRDVFWDVRTEGPEKAVRGDGQVVLPREPAEEDGGRSPAPETDYQAYQAELLARAEEHYRREEHALARRFYDSTLALGSAGALVYHHAALAAHLAGDTPRALAILQEAEAKLGDAGMRGAMWYNLGCFATRLGRFDDAMHYLGRAAARGCIDANKYRADPELAPLRWRDDFKQLLRSLPALPSLTGQGARP
jgi:hypothetical protein